MTEESVNALKERLAQDRKNRAEHPSGYRDFERGKRNVLTGESAKLSSKNFDRLMKERGIDPEDAKKLKNSFRAYTKKDPNEMVTTRHILKPEAAKNYNDGEWSSGNFQTKDNYKNSKAARKNLALPDKNDASTQTDTTINPKLANGKQHNVLEGTVARQNKDGEHFFKDRPGGGKQIVTDGGFNSGAVSKGESRPTNTRKQSNDRGQGY